MGILDNLKVIAGAKSSFPPNSDASKLGSQKKVLIVEDEKGLAEALELKFKKEGYEVFKGENGEEGLRLAIANNPDIILTDLLMPIMDGKTLLRKLRELPQFVSIPVIVLTNAGGVDNLT